MAARLTDAQKKKIVADYSVTGSYRATAKHFGVSDQTVRRVCCSEPEISRKVAQKKEENTADMLSFMESRKRKAQGVIDRCLDILPEKLKSASASQVATVMGIVADKFAKAPNFGGTSVTIVDDIPKVLENMETLADIVRHPVPNRDISDYE
ncbi:hypothetical protein C806_03010 [Lachnospiraceae bacterium 3-1]|nr:hypothetical protein C806_03010 [Lachnospiraceae bacterium 3-1]